MKLSEKSENGDTEERKKWIFKKKMTCQGLQTVTERQVSPSPLGATLHLRLKVQLAETLG